MCDWKWKVGVFRAAADMSAAFCRPPQVMGGSDSVTAVPAALKAAPETPAAVFYTMAKRCGCIAGTAGDSR